MRKVTIKDLYNMALRARPEVWQKSEAPDGEPRIYLHWTAGHYRQMFDDYHINITGNGDIYVSTDNLADKLEHTYHRNSGSVGITLCCACDANTNRLGTEPPTAKQIEAMAQAVAAVADGLWVTVRKHNVLTHGEAGDNEDGWYAHEPYGPKSTCERWDLEYLGTKESPKYNPWATNGTRGGDVLRGKALFYQNEWKKNGGIK